MVECCNVPSRTSHPHHERTACQSRDDPIERALVTLMFGMVVHFGTIWMVLSPRNAWHGYDTIHNDDNNDMPTITTSLPWIIPTILILHEYWIYLQHFNVLANPYCQRLDRQYGIALLRGNQHWAIAGTLSAYWCRESISMFLCLPFLVVHKGNEELHAANHNSQDSHDSNNSIFMTSTMMTTSCYLVVFSLLYHAMKSQGVRQDALRRYSPDFGIMRIVIDKFYLHSIHETLLTILRLSLQGIDTMVHGMILHDLWNSPYLNIPNQFCGGGGVGILSNVPFSFLISTTPVLLHCLFAVWVMHAAMNQYYKCSTATLMVQGWHWLTEPSRQASATTEKVLSKTEEELLAHSVSDDDDDGTDTESISDDSSTSKNSDKSIVRLDEDFVVRALLKEGRVPLALNGRRGAASRGVDTAIRIESLLTILAVVYVFGYGVAPFTILSTSFGLEGGFQWTWAISLYSWLLFGILSSIDSLLFPRNKHDADQIRKVSVSRWGSIRNMMDLAMIMIALPSSASYKVKALALLLAVVITTKSFLRSERWRAPKPVWYAMLGVEGIAKMTLTKLIENGSQDQRTRADAVVCLVWMCLSVSWSPTVSTGSPIESSTHAKAAPDIAFLSHPHELSDCWAFWLLPYRLDERWKRPWWSIPLWPIHYLVGHCACNLRVSLFGDGSSFFNADDVNYGGIQMQTWVSGHFTRHFFTSPWQVKGNIEAAAMYANQSGVKVLCLGALNKAESINGGGVGVVRALGPHPSVSIIHGNHLTAAAVVETARQCFGVRA